MYTYPFFPKLPSHSSCYGACQCWSLLTSWDPVCLVTLFGRKSLFKEWGSMTYFFKTQNQHRLFWSILHKKCIYSPYLINPLYIHTHTHIYMYIYVYIHTHIYMYIYICTWIHIYIWIYIYPYIYMDASVLIYIVVIVYSCFTYLLHRCFSLWSPRGMFSCPVSFWHAFIIEVLKHVHTSWHCKIHQANIKYLLP